MRLKLSLSQIEAFVKVSETQNFRSAAQALNLSQPSLTRSVHIAEQVVGARLFDRSTHHVELTPEGRQFYPIAKRILSEFDCSSSELAQFVQGNSGRVSIVVLPSIGVEIIPQAIVSFGKQNRKIQFAIHDAQAAPLLEMLTRGQADFGITTRPVNGNGFEFEPLISDELVLVCRRDDPLAKSAELPWSIFEKRPFIAPTRPGSIRPVCDELFERENIAVTPTYEIANWAVGSRLVAAGVGICAMPRLVLNIGDMSELATVPLVPLVSRSIGIVSLKGRTLSAAARLFLDAVRTHVKSLQAVEKDHTASGKIVLHRARIR